MISMAHHTWDDKHIVLSLYDKGINKLSLS